MANNITLKDIKRLQRVWALEILTRYEELLREQEQIVDVEFTEARPIDTWA